MPRTNETQTHWLCAWQASPRIYDRIDETHETKSMCSLADAASSLIMNRPDKGVCVQVGTSLALVISLVCRGLWSDTQREPQWQVAEHQRWDVV